MANPRKPTALKLLNGNPGKRKLNKQEPDPEYLAASDLVAPGWLTPGAKACWDEVAPQLQKARLVAKIDVSMLAMGCEALAQYRHATDQIEAFGAVVPAGEGKGQSLNVWVIVQSMAFKRAVGILRDFGVTPAARTRIALQGQLDLFESVVGDESSTNKYFTK